MLEIEIRDINNNPKGTISLSKEIFANEVDESVVHSSVLNYLANQRQGTHATKTRAYVSGGGKKPWKQKHTGRARHGSNRSPIWRGGGITFGPQPRDYTTKLTKRVKKQALMKALSMKLNDSEIRVVDSINIEKPSTKEVVRILKSIGLEDKKVLFITSEINKNLILSARNIPTADVTNINELNVYQIATHDYLIFTEDAIKQIQSNQEVVNQ
ncbi:MAG TPA: 50S ribosomal protein L4 [Nitrospirae bacterium]|nr:50S ribosomal protein L4 [Nitrospirota bacterium]